MRSQTILTKYHGPTDTKGGLISATASYSRARVYVGVDNSRPIEESHADAARKLMDKLNWRGTMIAGETETGSVWVFADGDTIEA